MTQHLWLAWNYQFQARCKASWDHNWTTAEFGNRVVWQGDGPRCKRCVKEAAALVANILRAIEGDGKVT